MAVTRCFHNMFQGVVVGFGMGMGVVYIFMEHQAKNIENMNKIEIIVLIFQKYI